jgi:hypothetical protein
MAMVRKDWLVLHGGVRNVKWTGFKDLKNGFDNNKANDILDI